MDPTSALHGLAGHSTALDAVMEMIAQNLIYAALPILAALWFRPAALRAGLAVGLGALLALGIAQLLAGAYGETRPFVTLHQTPLIPHSADGSFPSDHLCVLGAVAAGAWLGWPRLGGVAVMVAILVAVARVYVGVHYVLDVITGFAVGAAAAVAIWYALVPVLPTLHRVDAALRRRRLRPTAAPTAD